MRDAKSGDDRIPFSRVRLSGARLHIHRAIMFLVMSLVVTATITYFMDWHEVHETSSDFGQGLACAFIPDCDSSRFDDEPHEPRFTGVVTRDTGWDHSGSSVPLLLFFVLALAVWSAARPGFATNLAASIGVLLLFVGILAASFDLEHLFEHVVTLWAAEAHGLAVIGLFFVATASIVTQPILYSTARREMAALRALENAAHASD